MDSKPLKILMLEDVDEDAGLVKRTLSKEGWIFETHRVDTRAEFVQALREFPADVILSDHRLPQFNSFEALKLCKRLNIQVPFILVTGTVSEEFAVNCLKQGADDYVLKSNLARLPNAILNALRQRRSDVDRKNADRALRKQNEELAKINKELDSFVYSVSHNLRAPLMSVLGLVNLARVDDRKRDNIFDQYFNMMSHSIQRLDETLKEILDYSRNARHELNVGLVQIEALLNDCMDRLKYMDGSDTIVKEMRIDQTADLYSDGYRLAVIFNNLLSNAIKYRDTTKERSFVKFHVSITDRYAEIEIADNGIGVNDELLSRVFDMFFRATERSEGAGLGLYIVKETLEKLDGRIEVQSRYGEGTVFRIKIPNLNPQQELDR